MFLSFNPPRARRRVLAKLGPGGGGMAALELQHVAASVLLRSAGSPAWSSLAAAVRKAVAR